MTNPSPADPPSTKVPLYWDLLSESDRVGYEALKAKFNEGGVRRNRGHRVETFDTMLDAIRAYAERNDGNDWKRYLVCGVCWMDNAIAINTRQLRLLVTKCKSSINGSLQKLGYVTNTSHTESGSLLFTRIPSLRDRFTEIRQWTIRHKKDPNSVQQRLLPKLIPPQDLTRKSLPAIHVPRMQSQGTQQKEPVLPLKFRNMRRT